MSSLFEYIESFKAAGLLLVGFCFASSFSTALLHHSCAQHRKAYKYNAWHSSSMHGAHLEWLHGESDVVVDVCDSPIDLKEDSTVQLLLVGSLAKSFELGKEPFPITKDPVEPAFSLRGCRRKGFIHCHARWLDTQSHAQNHLRRPSSLASNWTQRGESLMKTNMKRTYRFNGLAFCSMKSPRGSDTPLFR